jgi:hypothetical protein
VRSRCKLVDVAPFLDLKDVLLRIATHLHRLIDQLTPKRKLRVLFFFASFVSFVVSFVFVASW